MVDPGSPPHRRQARAKADTTRTHHRMVTLAQSSSGDRSESPPQNKTATVMLDEVNEVSCLNETRQVFELTKQRFREYWGKRQISFQVALLRD